jgi:carotenoid 1,2-hydratase
MQIISDYTKDTRTKKSVPGSYEWWYFDAIDHNGYSIVVIFYEGNPFSKKYIQALSKGVNHSAEFYPAISISVYKDGKPLFYSFEESDPEFAEFSSEEIFGRVGENSFTGHQAGDEISYTLELNQTLPNGERISGELLFSSKSGSGISSSNFNQESSETHIWNLILPKCEVSGKLRLDALQPESISFKGTGYHDHNFGSEPMKESFDEWYWGRYHFDTSTLIYYVMNVKGEWDNRAWLIDQDGSVLALDSVELEEQGLTFFGLRSARRLKFKGEDFEAVLQKDQLIDSGPFYQRFQGNVLATLNGSLMKADGISEYIKPDRIYSKLFWPLVNMRIKYPGKAHWVQKSSKLYRWTW